MKNYLIAGLFCLVAFFAFGFEPVQQYINETTRQGTLKGVEECIAYSGSGLISENAVKIACVSAFQKTLYNGDLATGRAGPRNDKHSVRWAGTLNNKTTDHVTTWIKVSVSTFDSKGVEQAYHAETSIWIDPQNEAKFEVELPELEPKKLENLEFCDHEDLKPKECMTWGISNIQGLTI